MSNGLRVTVGPEEFSGKSTDEKLELIYQAVTAQQAICITTVEDFRERVAEYDDFIEDSTKVPKRNRKIDLGVGAGSGAIGGFSVSEIIDFIKNYFSGG